MGKWGICHANDGMTDKQNTAWGLVRDFSGRIDTDHLPSGTTSIRIELTDVEQEPVHYIHVRDDMVEVCETDLGLDTDVYSTSTLDVMTRVWYGEIDMTAAVESGRMQVTAAPVYTRRIGRWLRISSFTTDDPQMTPA